MADREKVVRAVETCFDSWIDKHRYKGLDLNEVVRMKRDALELLRAQEPVKPTWRQGFAFCGNCGRQFNRGFKYCPDCGKGVDWSASNRC